LDYHFKKITIVVLGIYLKKRLRLFILKCKNYEKRKTILSPV
jgi:hypothetical protein